MRTRSLAVLTVLTIACAEPASLQGDEALHTRVVREGVAAPWFEPRIPGAGKGAPGPCADSAWNHLQHHPLAIHVRTDGSDTAGTGSRSKPFASIERALATAAERPGNGVQFVALGAGTFSTSLVLDAATPKFKLIGCSPQETVLSAAHPAAPVLDVRGNKHVEARGLTLHGGLRTARVRDGGKLKLNDVHVLEPAMVGVLVESGSEAQLEDTRIIAPRVVNQLGWGAATVGGTLTLERGGIYEASGLGVFADGGAITSEDLEILDTAPTGPIGGLGRALHAQHGTDVTLRGGLFQGNADASVFLLYPGKVTIFDLVIDITSAGIVIDFPSTGLTGDGIVVKGGEEVVLEFNAIYDAERAGILLDGTSAELSGNETTHNGLRISGYTKFAQGGATATGDDADEVLRLHGPLTVDAHTIRTSALLQGD